MDHPEISTPNFFHSLCAKRGQRECYDYLQNFDKSDKELG